LQCSGAAEVQPRHGCALFEQTPFEVLEFDFSQVGFEEILIAMDILEVGTQTGTALVHSQALEND
jgi:hypothetical protein